MNCYNTSVNRYDSATGQIESTETSYWPSGGNLALGEQSRSPLPYGNQSPVAPYKETPTKNPGSVSDERLDDLALMLEDFIQGPLNGWEKKELAEYAVVFPDELFHFAVERAQAYRKYYWHYVRGILDNLREKGIRTLQEAQADRDAFDRKKSRRHKGYSTNNIYRMTIDQPYPYVEGETL